MEQVQTQAPQIKNLIDASNQFYQDLLGYAPEQTSLQSIPETQWNKFATQRGLNSNSSGIYLPRNQTVIIQGENLLSLFHEYFGHGLYCEQNLTGRNLVDLEKRLLEEEKQEFFSGRFSLENLQRFRNGNLTFQELENFRQENLGRYELFAIWTEYLLSGEHNLREDFESKYDSLSRQEKEAVDSVINFSGQYGNLATMYAQGMARRTTAERVRNLLENICNSKTDSIKFGVLFGSRREFSDIDIYLVSNEIEPFSSDWIDARVHTKKRFEESIKYFDVRVTDPLFSGEFVFGDRRYLEEQKQKLREQPITEEAIRYNLQKSEDYRNLSKENLELSDRVENPLSYAETYLANSLALREGLKLFTRNDLISYSHREKMTQLKGGARK
jgi:predicted nucleotidyltransferase